MSSIPDQYSLSQLSLPGTHNTCARYEPLSGTARCQALSLKEQLHAGIRFLDIRCRHLDNGFVIHHGAIYQNMDFDAVLSTCSDFLHKYPSESIIISVKEEYNPSNNTRSFEQTFDDYVKRYKGDWYLDAAIPTMQQARGKLVLLRRFTASQVPKGIDASH